MLVVFKLMLLDKVEVDAGDVVLNRCALTYTHAHARTRVAHTGHSSTFQTNSLTNKWNKI